MSNIDRDTHEKFIIDKPDCFNPGSSNERVKSDLNGVIKAQEAQIIQETIQHASTWILERDIWLQAENKKLAPYTETLSRGRVVTVNPGVNGIGREQRFIHPYIVLGEYKETMIAVPITNMAMNKKKEYYLRHYFEVELKLSKSISEEGKSKPFNEYRVKKPSVADIRNIAGIDKRRIVQDFLFTSPKFAPNSYLNAISEKMRESLAIIKEEDS